MKNHFRYLQKEKKSIFMKAIWNIDVLNKCSENIAKVKILNHSTGYKKQQKR